MAYIGKPIPRVEDLRFVTGRGCYTDDLQIEGALWCAFARAPYAHADVTRLDTTAAKVAPGVIAAFTVQDYYADGHKPMSHIPVPLDAVDSKRPTFTNTPETPIFDAPHPPLVDGRVRHVGEAVVMIVAETMNAARDAVELVEIDYNPLPAVVTQMDAIAQGAPQLWEGAPGNICFNEGFGDEAGTAAAFDGAHLVLEREFKNSRIVTCQMEPRAAVGRYDTQNDIYELLSGSQGAVRQRVELAMALGLPVERTRVVCPDTGGGFGTRTTLYAEQLLVTWAAKRLGRPVRWTSDRSEAFLTDYQGRDLFTRAAMAFDADGRIRAMRTEVYGNIGAHTVSFVPVANNYRVTTTAYHVPVAYVRGRGVLTNTAPTAPFRGAGRPEAHFTIERLLDLAAARLGIDRLEIRRRNLIRAEQLPYRNALGLTYDSGDFLGNFENALKMGDWDGFAERRKESEAKGVLRGAGVASYVESPVGAPRERMHITVKADGGIEVLAGTQSTGQGHETTFAQVVADMLGVDMGVITLVTGDTKIITVGGGTHSDRSMRLGGTLLVQACAEIVEQAKKLVAEELDVPEAEITFENGVLSHPSSNRAFDVFDAQRLAARTDTPLSSATEFNGRMPAYPTGCAICELEVDPETGVVKIVRYTSLDDVGQPINPLIVDGQVHGGIAQGVGQALMEDFQVDPATGQVMGGSFMDYGVPRADHFPHFDIEFTEDPTKGNPLRVKGGGESGITPSLATVFNALMDALSPYGIEHIEMPATPQRVWRAIQDARKAADLKKDQQTHG
jgi:carbon-monoxide dehydrogenase large subunit